MFGLDFSLFNINRFQGGGGITGGSSTTTIPSTPLNPGEPVTPVTPSNSWYYESHYAHGAYT